MIRKARTNKKTYIALTIILISLVDNNVCSDELFPDKFQN